jgi:DNA invertase Pin-like site-specific DNA recombinase
MTIFEEKKSGTRRDGRTELQVLLECVREGDTAIVTRIDRLARSMKDLQDIVHGLKEKGVSLKATEQPIDTGSAAPERRSSICLACSPVRDEFAPRATTRRNTASKGEGRL